MFVVVVPFVSVCFCDDGPIQVLQCKHVYSPARTDKQDIGRQKKECKMSIVQEKDCTMLIIHGHMNIWWFTI